MEGQQGRPTWRSRPYISIEQRVCYECGKLGHISYNCPKLQAQGKLASIARSNPTSCKEAENPSSNKCDKESSQKRIMNRMSTKYKPLWLEEGNDRKGRMHGQPGEGKRKQPRCNPLAQYNRQQKELRHQDK